MDPLHPLVPIQPPPPTPPDYTPVRRIERDHDREAAPDWEQPADDQGEDQERDEYADDYDPEWVDPSPHDGGYGPDGVRHELADTADGEHERDERWDPRRHGDRRARRRSSPPAPDDEAGSGPHIDISA